MNAAIDLRVFKTASDMSDEEAFAETFDQAVTRSGTDEPFEAWCDWFGASFVPVHTENDIAIGLLTLCPFCKSDDYKDEAVYHVGCMMHGSEEAYIKFLTTGT